MIDLMARKSIKQGLGFDLFGDMDIVTCLYSDMYLDESNIYHFAYWNRKQFYMDDKN